MRPYTGQRVRDARTIMQAIGDFVVEHDYTYHVTGCMEFQS